MKTTLAASLARFADLSDGDLFIGKFNDKNHVMMKAYDIENGDRVEWPVILSPTLELFDNKPGLVQKNVVERDRVVRLKDFELYASLDLGRVTIERGYSPDVGAIFVLEQGAHLCAGAREPISILQSVLINIETGEIIKHSEPLANAKTTSWQIRRRVGDEVEIIVQYA